MVGTMRIATTIDDLFMLRLRLGCDGSIPSLSFKPCPVV